MRLGILTSSYPRHADDWAGAFVADFAGWLAGQGDRVDVLAPDPARSVHPGVQVHALRYARKPGLFYGAGAPDNLLARRASHARWRAWSQVPSFVARLSCACRTRCSDWDAVVSHWLLPCGVVGALATARRPHLAIAHSSDVHLLRRLPAASLALRALARPRSRLVLTSEALRGPLRVLADRTARQWVEQAAVVPMGFDPPPLVDGASKVTLRARLGLDARRPVVLFVGRLVPVKGVDRLIRACEDIDAQVVVVGDGPQRAALQAQAHAAAVEIRFAGAQGRTEKWRWLRAADLLVIPSVVLPDGRTDSAPLTLLEGLAAGLPVVASRVGGASDLVQHGISGLLVPPADTAALRKAISRLIAAGPLRRKLGTAARDQARQFEWNRTGRRLRALIGQL